MVLSGSCVYSLGRLVASHVTTRRLEAKSFTFQTQGEQEPHGETQQPPWPSARCVSCQEARGWQGSSMTQGWACNVLPEAVDTNIL